MSDTYDWRKPVGYTPNIGPGLPVPESKRAQIQTPGVVKGDFGQDEWARMAKSAEKLAQAGMTEAHAGESITQTGLAFTETAVQQMKVAAHSEADIATTKDVADLANKHRDDPQAFDAALQEYKAQRVANSSPFMSRYIDRTVGERGASAYAGLVARKGAKDEAIGKDAAKSNVDQAEDELTTMFSARKGVDTETGDYTPEASKALQTYQDKVQAGVGTMWSQETANNRVNQMRNTLMGIQVGNNAVDVLKTEGPEGGEKKAFEYIDEHITRNDKLPMDLGQRERMAAHARAQVHREIAANRTDAGDATVQAQNQILQYKSNDPNDWPSLQDHEALVARLKANGTNGAAAKVRELEIARGVAQGTIKRIQDPSLSNKRSQMNYDNNTDYITDTPVTKTIHPVLASIRTPIRNELDTSPNAIRYLVARTEQETANNGPDGKLMFIEESMNRRLNPARGYRGIIDAVSDPNYYPGPVDLRRATPQKIEEYRPLIQAALNGSNTSDLSTGNASWDERTQRFVGFGRGGVVMKETQALNVRGVRGTERHGREAADLPWVSQTIAAMESGDTSGIQAAAVGARTGTQPIVIPKESGVPPMPKPSGTAPAAPAAPPTPDYTPQAIQSEVKRQTDKRVEQHYKDMWPSTEKNLAEGLLTKDDLANILEVARTSTDRSWADPVMAKIGGYLVAQDVNANIPLSERQEAIDNFMAEMRQKGQPLSYQSQLRQAIVDNLKKDEENARRSPIDYHISKQGNPPLPLRFDNADAMRLSMQQRGVITDSVSLGTGVPLGSQLRPQEAAILASKITNGKPEEAAIALGALKEMTPEQLTAALGGENNPIKAALTNGARSRDPARMTAVMQTLDDIERKDVGTFKTKFGEQTAHNLNVWRDRKDIDPPALISEDLNAIKDPKVQASREAARKEGDIPNAVKAITMSDVVKAFGGPSWYNPFGRGSVNAPVDYEMHGGGGLMQGQLLQQYKHVYEQLLLDGVPADQAKERAATVLKNEWGVSRANSMAIMRYPPEHPQFNKVYPAVGGRYDYMSDQVSEFVANAQVAANAADPGAGQGNWPFTGAYTPKPGSVADIAVQGLKRGGAPGSLLPGLTPGNTPIREQTGGGVQYTFQTLISDRQTEIEAGAGGKPSYQVMVLDQNGRQVILPGRVNFDAGPAQAAERARFEREAGEEKRQKAAMSGFGEQGRAYVRTLTATGDQAQRAESGGGGDTLTDTGMAAATRGEPNVGAAAGALSDHPVIQTMERLQRGRRAAEQPLPPETTGEAQKKSEVEILTPGPQGEIEGQIEPGNIDLAKRALVPHEGGIATVRSMSFEEDGQTILVPTVVNGTVVSPQRAIEHYHQTGEHLGKFQSHEAADKYAEDLHVAQEKYYLPERVERQALGFLNSLLARDPKPKPADPTPTMAQYPSDEDVEFAKSNGFGYGSIAEPYINQQTAKVYGDVRTMPAPAQPKGKPVAPPLMVFTARSAAGTTMTDILNAVNDDTRNINVDLTDPQNKAIRDRIGHTYAKAAMAVEGNAVAKLGFDPNRIMLDVRLGEQTGTVNIGGLYGPKQDAIYSNLAGPGTLVHESIHRGLQMLRAKHPELAETFKNLPPEELVVRYMMVKYAGDVEASTGEAGLAQRKAAIEAFDKSLWGTTYKNNVEKLLRVAERDVAEKRPGGPR